MKDLLTMLYREWLEWQKTVYIILGLFVALLLFGTYGSYRVSQQIDRNVFQINIFSDESKVEFSKKGGDKGWNNIEWDEGERKDAKPLKMEIRERPNKLLAIWAHSMRGILLIIMNVLLLGFVPFYLADALYKERADGSTFYFRSLPISDVTLLSSKVLFGYVGVILLSYIMSLILMLYSPVLVPGVIKDILAETGLSISQFDMGDLFVDWAVFHLVVLLWLLPFAMYFFFISSVVKNRPLFYSFGILITAAILWQIIFGDIGVPNQITVNFGLLTTVLKEQWMNISVHLTPGEQIDLFDSFTGYLFSVRTLVSLIISAGFGYGTYRMYTKNIEVS